MANEEITKRGVLVADPSAYMAGLVTTMLRGLGRKDIREANDASKAMIELMRRSFDVVIINDVLGGMDGVAFTRKLRAHAECPNRLVPIIMISAAPDAERIAAARDAGVTEFLRKPFAANHLQTRLDSIEANPRSFIEAPQFKGPDRRRKTVDVGANDRRSDAGPDQPAT
jgi:PleD family two-component response regulator